MLRTSMIVWTERQCCIKRIVRSLSNAQARAFGDDIKPHAVFHARFAGRVT